jgi:microcystin-dependent protein
MTMRLRPIAFLCFALLAAMAAPHAASAQSTCILTEVRWFTGDFEPRNWRFAHGQLLSINQNQALFALLGDTYGGNGTTNFALPDLRGRMVVGSGQGPELSNRAVGEQGGADQITLSTDQMPSHTHGVIASGAPPTASDPGGNVWAENPRAALYDAAVSGVNMSPSAISTSGGGQPHPNTMPFQALRPIICTEGVFPSSN